MGDGYFEVIQRGRGGKKIVVEEELKKDKKDKGFLGVSEIAFAFKEVFSMRGISWLLGNEEENQKPARV
ncbi:hypothetical protein KY358_00165 [Candidatus Woesearchaeota archaeon]|nr:hypothetical protein [Candidatus Woesearchaeota archaeon]